MSALPRQFQCAILLVLGCVAIVGSMAPLAPGGDMIAPDLLYCILAAAVIRAPNAVPLWMVVALALAADVFLARPVGLGALALLLSVEVLRSNSRSLRASPFLFEWCVVSLVFVAQLALMHLMLRLTFLDGPNFATNLRYAVATVAAYPIVCATFYWGLGLRSKKKKLESAGVSWR